MKIYLTFFALCYFTISNSQRFKDVIITPIALSNNVYMLTGAGGNIGVSIGEDGVFIIDD